VSSSLCFSPNLFLRPYDSAPELLRCDIKAQRRARSEGKAGYGPAVDCWAIGVLAYECLVGKVPHEGTSMDEMLEKIDRSEFCVGPTMSRSLSLEAQNFIMRCMDDKPTTRLTAQEMLSHPWLVKHYPPVTQPPKPWLLSTPIIFPAAECAEHQLRSASFSHRSVGGCAGGRRTSLSRGGGRAPRTVGLEQVQLEQVQDWVCLKTLSKKIKSFSLGGAHLQV
jgi:serine/threonine protein kinase